MEPKGFDVPDDVMPVFLDDAKQCKIHAIPILIHQTRISIIYISLVMQNKHLDIRNNIMTVKTQTNPNRFPKHGANIRRI
jgi:hypothetical protein